MISLPDRASIERALTEPVRADLKNELHARIRHTLEAGLSDLTHILVVEGRDTEQTILNEIGFTPFANPIDGARHGSPGFIPGWDHLRERGGWFEMIWTIGNSGYAIVFLIEDIDGPSAQLCRAYIANIPDP